MPQKVQELFDNYEVKRSPAEWALRWVWNHPEVSVVLSGMNTMEELEENLKIAEEANPNSLSDEELNTLKQAKAIFENKLQINCTSCGYCLPCPSGVNIPENFQKYNDYYLFGSPEEKDSYQFSYDALVLENERASQCIECGICEEHCTQDIKIIKELKKVKELYGSN
jgi:predicted aldo/keto reductase-like oxidoreductase